MQVCAAWLSLLLAAPGLASPAASPAASSEATRARIFTVITESDPEVMTPPRVPRPLAELVEAAALAGSELARATPAEVDDLLSLMHDARELAYRRSNSAVHLCAELDVLALLVQRKDLAETSAARAKRFEVAGREALAKQHPGHVCEAPQVSQTPEPEEVMPLQVSQAPEEATRLQVSQAPQEAPPATIAVNSSASRRAKASPATITGGVLLAVAGGLAVAVAPVQASRVRLRDEADELRHAVGLAGGATLEQARQAEELEQAADRTRSATIGLSVSAAAVAALGVLFVVVGVRKPRLELMPQGGPQGAGLMLRGRF
jgi:hypothetical protein